jgi:hypothetical protein
MKTTVRGVEDTIRGTREDWMLLGRGLQLQNRRKRDKKLEREKKIQR